MIAAVIGSSGAGFVDHQRASRRPGGCEKTLERISPQVRFFENRNPDGPRRAQVLVIGASMPRCQVVRGGRHVSGGALTAGLRLGTASPRANAPL